ncbi:MAG: hypothetical protein OXE53_11435, partial [Deltaproteobacteria bacterium]|nr:hypothetical protein [Deltaproteobacteria bacterium]
MTRAPSLRSLLLLLTVALVALAVFFVHDSRPASAQAPPASAQAPGTTVWSATMTAAQVHFDAGFNSYEHPVFALAGSLTDSNFMYAGEQYEVKFLYPRLSGLLQFGLDKPIPLDLTLHVGSAQFRMTDATLSSLDSRPYGSFGYWEKSGVAALAVGATIEVSLTVSLPLPPPPAEIDLWASTLTVKDLGPLAGDGCIGQQQCSDQLASDNSFTYGGRAYNVLALRVAHGYLQLLLDKAPPLHPDQLRLDVGDKQFQFKDAIESWGIDRNEDAWRLTWHGAGLSWSDGDTVSVSLVGRNVVDPGAPAPHTDLHPVRVHYDEMRGGQPVDNFNNLRLARPKPSTIPGTFERRVQLRAYIPGQFPSADPEKGMVTTTHVMLRVTAHPNSTLEWAIGNVYGVTGTFASFPNGGYTPAIALNPSSKWTYVYIRVTNGSQSATHHVAIDPPPRTYTLSPQVSVTEGEEATLTLSLGTPAGAGGVSFTVTADYPDGGATAEDVGQFAATLTVPEGQQSARIIIPTVDDEAVEEDEERFTV